MTKTRDRGERERRKMLGRGGKTYLGGCGGKWRETRVGVYAATYLALRTLSSFSLFNVRTPLSMLVSRMQGDLAGISCASENGARLWRARKYPWEGKSFDAMKN